MPPNTATIIRYELFYIVSLNFTTKPQNKSNSLKRDSESKGERASSLSKVKTQVEFVNTFFI